MTTQTTTSTSQTEAPKIDDRSLLSLMTDVSEYKPSTEKTEEQADWRMTLVG